MSARHLGGASLGAASIVVVGGILFDAEYKAVLSTARSAAMLGTSNECRLIRRGPGGVGRNVAEACCRLFGTETTGGPTVAFVSVVADDPNGQFLLKSLQPPRGVEVNNRRDGGGLEEGAANRDWRHRLDISELAVIAPPPPSPGTGSVTRTSLGSSTTSSLLVSSAAVATAEAVVATASYLSIVDGAGGLVLGAACDLNIFDRWLTPQRAVDATLRLINRNAPLVDAARTRSRKSTKTIVVFDGNVPRATLDYAVTTLRRALPVSSTWLVYDPISREQALKALPLLSQLDLMKPNVDEVAALAIAMLQRPATAPPPATASKADEWVDCIGCLRKRIVQRIADASAWKKKKSASELRETAFRACVAVLILLTRVRHVVYCTMGSDGVIVGLRRSVSTDGGSLGSEGAYEASSSPFSVSLTWLPALTVPMESIAKPTGGGDTFLGAVLSSLVASEVAEADPAAWKSAVLEAALNGLSAAVITICDASPGASAISPSLSPGAVEAMKQQWRKEHVDGPVDLGEYVVSSVMRDATTTCASTISFLRNEVVVPAVSHL